MKTALYAGSFDPITNGHLDVIERASKLFDKLIVTVAINASKNSLFTLEERLEQVRETCQHLDNVEVHTITGLLIDAVNKFDACAVVRGLRSVSDFDYESAMAMMNREINGACETLFLMPSPKFSFVSSRMIREIASYEGDIRAFVPEHIATELTKRLQNND